jgi:hypothetical protein
VDQHVGELPPAVDSGGGGRWRVRSAKHQRKEKKKRERKKKDKEGGPAFAANRSHRAAAREWPQKQTYYFLHQLKQNTNRLYIVRFHFYCSKRLTTISTSGNKNGGFKKATAKPNGKWGHNMRTVV